MTREEAVEVLKERYITCVGIGLDNHANRVNEALDMAIEALSAEAVEVVRCKDCKYWREWENRVGSCHRSENRYNWFGVDSTDYCSFGERREP